MNNGKAQNDKTLRKAKGGKAQDLVSVPTLAAVTSNDEIEVVKLSPIFMDLLFVISSPLKIRLGNSAIISLKHKAVSDLQGEEWNKVSHLALKQVSATSSLSLASEAALSF
ncbi:hypothetical protein J6590_085722 [Homalodisca vitripennis]|nr:hypothetical protein J6590_085722 [Homalodisca vitripennis]